MFLYNCARGKSVGFYYKFKLKYIIFITLCYILSFSHCKENSAKFDIVTNNPICTIMAKNYVKLYPTIKSHELFIVTSVCEGIVHPMDSGLGGGFQMTLYNHATKKSYYINSREMSGKIVPDGYGQKHSMIYTGVPSMLAGYQYIYKTFNSTVPWDKLFTENIQLAKNGFQVSKTFSDVLFRYFNHIPSIWKLIKRSNDVYELRTPVLAKYLTTVAKAGPDKQPFYDAESIENNYYLANELKSSKSLITEKDVQKYVVKMDNAPTTKCFDMLMISSNLPGSGLLQLFGCRVLERLIKVHKINKIATNEDNIFIKIWIEYYMYSLKMHLKAFKHQSQIDKLLTRDVNIVAKKLYVKLRQNKLKNTLPKSIATRVGYTKLPLKNVLNAVFDESGTSNICIGDRRNNAEATSLCATSTINNSFGSMTYSKRFGFFYNNQLADFTYYNKYNLNRPMPYKVPQSSIAPTLFIDPTTNQLSFSLGAAGGSKIISGIFTIMFERLLNLKTTTDIKECTYYQNRARCTWVIVRKKNTAGMKLICESSIDENLFNGSNIKPSFSVEAGYSAVTAIFPNAKFNGGCYDPRRGGLGVRV